MSETTTLGAAITQCKQLRDDNGLLASIEHKFDENGMVDWLAMLPSSYFGVKSDCVTEVVNKYGKDIDQLDLRTVAPYYLYIKLGGMNYLATLRGYTSIRHKVDYVSETKCVDTCELELIPNFETGFSPCVCAGVASASVYNVSSGFEYVLEALAENRAFSRAVRRALRINIVTQEELGDKKAGNKNKKDDATETAANLAAAADSYGPSSLLVTICQMQNLSFEKLKVAAIAKPEGLIGNPSEWTGFDSIKPNDCFTLLSRIKEANEKRTDKKPR